MTRRRLPMIFEHYEEADPSWRLHAACRDTNPDWFFPERGAPTLRGKQICATCPVTEACLEFALASNTKWGTWGGLSEKQRRALRRERARNERKAS